MLFQYLVLLCAKIFHYYGFSTSLQSHFITYSHETHIFRRNTGSKCHRFKTSDTKETRLGLGSLCLGNILNSDRCIFRWKNLSERYQIFDGPISTGKLFRRNIIL